MLHNNIIRGEVFYADLPSGKGSVQSGLRPVVVIQNNIGNKFSPTVHVAPLTSVKKKILPTHVKISCNNLNGLNCDSIVLVEQAATIDKASLKSKIGILSGYDMFQINLSILISFGMSELINEDTMSLIQQCA